MEYSFSFLGIIFFIIFTSFIAAVKSIDWLISLKYVSKDNCNSCHYNMSENLEDKFATIESHNNLKEDITEMKDKLADVHNVIMTFAVHHFKEK